MSFSQTNDISTNQQNVPMTTSYSIFGSDGDESIHPNDINVPEEDLRAKGFKQLRFEMLCDYINVNNVSTMDELLKIRAEQIGTDKSHLPLYVQRTEKRTQNLLYTGRVGLIGCRREGCLRCEDGFEPFKTCSGCKGPCYCSADCQRAAWPTHKLECNNTRRQRREHKKSNKSAQEAMQELQSIFANAPTIPGTSIPLIPLN